jgi:hypothetical protein
MRTAIVSLAFVVALGTVEAAAQPVNLTGRYICVVNCQPGFKGYPAFITQNGWAVNLINEAGVPARAWMDWVRIWVPAYNQGAVFSPDGMTIQFDGGTIWRRDLGAPRRRGRR